MASPTGGDVVDAWTNRQRLSGFEAPYGTPGSVKVDHDAVAALTRAVESCPRRLRPWPDQDDASPR